MIGDRRVKIPIWRRLTLNFKALNVIYIFLTIHSCLDSNSI